MVDPESAGVGFLHFGELLVEELLLRGRGLLIGLDELGLADGLEKLNVHIRNSNIKYLKVILVLRVVV